MKDVTQSRKFKKSPLLGPLLKSGTAAAFYALIHHKKPADGYSSSVEEFVSRHTQLRWKLFPRLARSHFKLAVDGFSAPGVVEVFCRYGKGVDIQKFIIRLSDKEDQKKILSAKQVHEGQEVTAAYVLDHYAATAVEPNAGNIQARESSMCALLGKLKEPQQNIMSARSLVRRRSRSLGSESSNAQPTNSAKQHHNENPVLIAELSL